MLRTRIRELTYLAGKLVVAAVAAQSAVPIFSASATSTTSSSTSSTDKPQTLEDTRFEKVHERWPIEDEDRQMEPQYGTIGCSQSETCKGTPEWC